MVASPQQVPITPQEFLQMEERSAIKHEYQDGQVYAVAGASDAHVTLLVISLLRYSTIYEGLDVESILLI